MTTVCSFCNSMVRPGERTDSPVSHGVCKSCYARFVARYGIDLKKYISLLGVPVLIVDNDVTVLEANTSARELAAKPGGEILGKRAGTVYECKYSHLPGGCGRSIHCSGCAIRISVTETWTSGQPVTRRPAVLNHESNGDEKEIHFFVSTRKEGDAVLLAIEPPGDG
nr:hypothetical protein [uncultured Methanoregula sp.]